MIQEVSGVLILKDDVSALEVDRNGFVWMGDKNHDVQIYLSKEQMEALRNFLTK